MEKLITSSKNSTYGRFCELDKHTTDLDTVITPENVLYLGENIAICSLKHLLACRGESLLSLYYDLIRDIRCKSDYSRPLSDGYDFAQTAICFLCEHMGQKLGDMVMGKYKRPVTIKHACASEVGNLAYKRCQYNKNTQEINYKDPDKNAVQPFEEDMSDQSREHVETIIKNMNLKEKQAKVLECYMQGMGVCQISRLLSIATCTVWRYRMLFQHKYTELTGYQYRV